MKKKNFSIIGKPLRKIDAMAKCAGETVYADDLNLPRTIYAKLLRSPHPHARVLGINAARALKLDGMMPNFSGRSSPVSTAYTPSSLRARAALMPSTRACG